MLAFRCCAPFQRWVAKCLLPDTMEPEDEGIGAGGSSSAASVLMQDCMVQKSPGVNGISISRSGNSAPFPGHSPSPWSKGGSAHGLLKASVTVFHIFPLCNAAEGEKRRGSGSVCQHSQSHSRAGPGQDQVLHIGWGLQLRVCLGDGMKPWSQQAAEKTDYIGSSARRAGLI